MTVIAKPEINPWISETICDPAFAWVWRQPMVMMPMQEGGGSTTRAPDISHHKGTITSATWVTTEVGRALNFDGINDVVDVTTVDGIGAEFGNGDFSVFAYFIPDTSDNTTRRVLSDFSSAGTTASHSFSMHRFDNDLRIVVASGSTVVQVSAGTLTTEVPNVVVATYDSSALIVTCWVDGVEAGASDALPGAINNGTDFQFGRAGAATGSGYFDGDILLIVLLPGILSDAQIVQWSADPFGPLRTQYSAVGLVAAAVDDFPAFYQRKSTLLRM